MVMRKAAPGCSFEMNERGEMTERDERGRRGMKGMCVNNEKIYKFVTFVKTNLAWKESGVGRISMPKLLKIFRDATQSN